VFSPSVGVLCQVFAPLAFGRSPSGRDAVLFEGEIERLLMPLMLGIGLQFGAAFSPPMLMSLEAPSIGG